MNESVCIEVNDRNNCDTETLTYSNWFKSFFIIENALKLTISWQKTHNSNKDCFIKIYKKEDKYWKESYTFMKQSAEDDVIDGDEEKFDDVTDASHNCESQCTWCSDLLEFYIYRKMYLQRLASRRPTKICMTQQRTFLLIGLRFRFLCSWGFNYKCNFE